MVGIIGWAEWETDMVMSQRRQEGTEVEMVVMAEVVDGMNRTRMTGEDEGRAEVDGVKARESLGLCRRGIGGGDFEGLSSRWEMCLSICQPG